MTGSRSSLHGRHTPQLELGPVQAQTIIQRQCTTRGSKHTPPALTQLRTWSHTEEAADRAELRPRALITAAPRCCTCGVLRGDPKQRV